jgi:hypothetical protein
VKPASPIIFDRVSESTTQTMAKKRVQQPKDEDTKEDQVEIDSEVVREELSEVSEDDDDNGDYLNDDDILGSDDSLDDDDEDDDDKIGQEKDGEDQEESGSSEEEEGGDDSEEGDEPDSRLNAVGSAKFASALKRLLGAETEEEIKAEPAKLFQRKTKIMKLGEAELIEKKKHRKQLEEKNKFDLKSVTRLPEKDPSRINRERDLKRIATRGVVALFNAIGAHQRAAASGGGSMKTESKESFLKLLQEKATGGGTQTAKGDVGEKDDDHAEPQVSSSGWKVLQEDYLENADEVESEEDNEAMDDIDEEEDESE